MNKAKYNNAPTKYIIPVGFKQLSSSIFAVFPDTTIFLVFNPTHKDNINIRILDGILIK